MNREAPADLTEATGRDASVGAATRPLVGWVVAAVAAAAMAYLLAVAGFLGYLMVSAVGQAQSSSGCYPVGDGAGSVPRLTNVSGRSIDVTVASWNTYRYNSASQIV